MVFLSPKVHSAIFVGQIAVFSTIVQSRLKNMGATDERIDKVNRVAYCVFSLISGASLAYIWRSAFSSLKGRVCAAAVGAVLGALSWYAGIEAFKSLPKK